MIATLTVVHVKFGFFHSTSLLIRISALRLHEDPCFDDERK